MIKITFTLTRLVIGCVEKGCGSEIDSDNNNGCASGSLPINILEGCLMDRSYVSYKTKEEFEKAFKEIHNSGKESGFDDGLAMGLSFLYDILDKFESVDPNILTKAQYYARQRHIENFNKRLKTPKTEDKE